MYYSLGKKTTELILEVIIRDRQSLLEIPVD
jgi:hypothetical protein